MPDDKMILVKENCVDPWPQGYKTFFYSNMLSLTFKMLINVKITKFNGNYRLNDLSCLYNVKMPTIVYIHEQDKFHAQLS